MHYSLDLASLICRASVGTFFAVSGYHKLFNHQRRASLSATFDADHVQPKTFFMWAIPAGELAGGLGVLTGTLTWLATVGLIALCLGACALDGYKRVNADAPLDAADRIDDWLYLPEILYTVLLVTVLLMGPGIFSVDYAITHL